VRTGTPSLVNELGLDRLASLAIMGLGKNAGKTTVLNHIVRACDQASFPRVLALTSVGRDGEDEDLVTGGMKPRIFVKEGWLAATARGSVGKCDAVLEILALTGIHTATGEIAIARARSGGYLELAGPSMAQDLSLCEKLLRREEPDCLFLVDGALDRKSQAGGGLTQAVVLVAGMANAASMEELAEKTAAQVSLLTLPSMAEADRLAMQEAMDESPGARAVIIGEEGTVRVLEMPSLVGHERQVAESLLPDDRVLLLRGAVTERLVDALLSAGGIRGMTLAAEDGTRFFITARTLARLERQKVKLAVIHELQLPAIFVNPARRDGSLADEKALVKAIRSLVDLPVFEMGPALD
ncbi:MAG: hypothetical protein GX819_06130, partial [Clostridiaceae bacterium]|nr:hypothetical protein [Clostridiaceae bacterium]